MRVKEDLDVTDRRDNRFEKLGQTDGWTMTEIKSVREDRSVWQR